MLLVRAVKPDHGTSHDTALTAQPSINSPSGRPRGASVSFLLVSWLGLGSRFFVSGESRPRLASSRCPLPGAPGSQRSCSLRSSLAMVRLSLYSGLCSKASRSPSARCIRDTACGLKAGASLSGASTGTPSGPRGSSSAGRRIGLLIPPTRASSMPGAGLSTSPEPDRSLSPRDAPPPTEAASAHDPARVVARPLRSRVAPSQPRRARHPVRESRWI
jgi:hypothetical protein